MSNSLFNFKKFLKKYFNFKNIFWASFWLLFSIAFIMLYIYGINKKWYDGMSVCGMIYALLGLLMIILDIAKFDTWYKLKKLFQIKKENNEELTKFEKQQMKILNLKDDEEERKIKKEKSKITRRFVAYSMIIFGLIILIISLPFCF